MFYAAETALDSFCMALRPLPGGFLYHAKDDADDDDDDDDDGRDDG